MKKVLATMMTAMACMAAVTSCSDNNADTQTTPPNPGEAKKDTADYTVIFWGDAGKNDGSAAVDMYSLAKNFQDGRIDNKKVNIAGMLKTTIGKATQDNGKEIDWSNDKTIYFCSDTIGQKPIDELLDGVSVKTPKEELYKRLYGAASEVLNSKEHSVSYPISNIDSLANFIQRSAKKFPARHYVLMVFGHGGGFSPVEDTPHTKVCLPDSYYDDAYITADGLVNAVKKSGVETQTLFTQCCLMAALENMAAFSEVFHYGILSAETTYGGYFPEYLVKLTEAGDDEQKMKEKSKELVDYYVALKDRYPNTTYYSSHGFYDLSQMPQLLASVKEATQWYVENYADASLQYGIEKAARGTTMCISLDRVPTSIIKFRQQMRDLAKKELDIKDVSTQDLQAIAYNLKEAMTAKAVLSTFLYGYSFSDLLKSTMESKEADIPAEKTAQLKAIYEKYMKTLKAMAYINTTETPANASADYPYIYASPTINIFALNPDFYIPIGGGKSSQEYYSALTEAIDAGDYDKMQELFAKLFEGNIFAYFQPNLSITKANYQASVFDKEVGWSKFLEMIQFNPSMFLNPERKDYSGQ